MSITIRGIVIKGRQLGRTINFPTANVALDSTTESIPSGVYLSRVMIDGLWYDSITNIGINPTVEGVYKRSESYILDFSEDLYGKHITICLGEKLRDEMRFESLESLQEQIARDVIAAKSRLK